MRASLVIFIQDNEGRPIAGATVRLRKPGTVNDIDETIFAGDTGSNPDTVLPQPLQSGTDGKVQVFLNNPRRVDVFASKAGEVDPQTIPAVALKPGLNLRGAWSNVVTYQENDAVSHDGQTWAARRQNLNVVPVEGADWILVAAKGAAGVSPVLADVAPPAVADAGAVGASGDAAREDHTHALHPQTARKDIAQTFTEDQTIETGNSLLVGTSGVVQTTGAAGAVQRTYNARHDGTNWIRLQAVNGASLLQQGADGSIAYFTNTDAGTTVGSIITWGEKFRITKDGKFVIQGPAATRVAEFKAVSDAFAQTVIGSDGRLWFGPGNADIDTNLYRGGANLLTTDDKFSTNGYTASFIMHGNGSPEGAITASPGSLYLNIAGGAGTTLYIKQSGTGNTGWVGK